MKVWYPIQVAALVALVACAGQDAETTDAAVQPDTGAAQTPAAGAPPTAAAPEQTGTGPCAYISEADATQVMGQPMKFGQAAQEGECLLVASSGDATISVSFSVHPSTAMYDQMATGAGAEPVSGVGDRPVALQTGASTMVAAVKGSRGYVGAVYNANQQAAARDQAVEVAKRVTARL